MIDFRGSQIHYSRFVPNSLSIQESQGNEKEFWKAHKKTLPSSKTSGNITNLCSDGIVVTSTYSIVNALNCFFVSIGQKLAENFPNVSLSAKLRSPQKCPVLVSPFSLPYVSELHMALSWAR